MRLRLVLFLLVGIAAATELPARAAPDAEAIAIKGISFKRPNLTVSKNTTVVWKDRDAFTSHTVTSRGDSRFRSSDTLQKGDSHRVTFTERGTYRYFCRVHPANMRGSVRVK